MKGGEDVRTDERMEVILDVCNGLMARHPGAASHRLKVHLVLHGASQRSTVTGLDESVGSLQCSIDLEAWCVFKGQAAGSVFARMQ